MSRIWFVTGSSRGLGRSLTEAVLVHGDLIAATAEVSPDLKEISKKYSTVLQAAGFSKKDCRRLTI